MRATEVTTPTTVDRPGISSRGAQMPSSSKSLPRVSDTTLRDSAHMPGVDFSPRDGVIIARLLLDVGIDAIEVGIVSAVDRSDLDLCRAVLDEVGPDHTMTLVLARNRQQVRRDLELAYESGFRAVMLSIPTSVTHARLKLGTESRQRILSLAAGAIDTAKELGFHTTFSAEDGARTDLAFLENYAAKGLEAGADRLRLAETVSVLTPATTGRMVSAVVGAAPGLEVEIHSHNMLGLAVANALAAVDAGASWVSATVGGLGERGGNTPLAEILVCMWQFWDDTRYDLPHLTKLSHEVETRSGIPFGATCGPTASLSYNYEVGGQWKNPEVFEAVPAEIVGNQRGIRVRTRIRPALLRAFVSPDLMSRFDADKFIGDLLEHHLPSGRNAFSEADLLSLVSAYASRSTEERGIKE